MDFLTSARALRRWSVANLVANMVIVWTGALVRLTKSGLGCPTWPQCEPGSYVPTGELGIHGVIEFGNRLLTFVLAAIALAAFITAVRRFRAGLASRRLVGLTFGVGIGIIAQAVIGGTSVRMQLNPWVVGLHMVASVVLVLICVEIVHLAFETAPAHVPARMALLTWTVFVVGLLVTALGVVVTGAGPHSGDGGAQRNGLSPELTAKLHAWSVWALVGLTVLGVLLAWSDVRLRRLWVGLLAVELLQGVIGYVQYFTHLPIAMVLMHMVGTTLFVAVLGHVTFLTRSGSSGVVTPTPTEPALDHA